MSDIQDRAREFWGENAVYSSVVEGTAVFTALEREAAVKEFLTRTGALAGADAAQRNHINYVFREMFNKELESTE